VRRAWAPFLGSSRPTRQPHGSLIVVILTVALVNEMVERRRRRRLRVVAQYVMLELVRKATRTDAGIAMLVSTAR
jgi:hypothetical protein